MASQFEDSPVPPDQAQQQMSFTIAQYAQSSKGYFKPWAVLNTPQPGHAFRFVYPTLAVVNPDTAWLINVETWEMEHTFEHLQTLPTGLGLGETH